MSVLGSGGDVGSPDGDIMSTLPAGWLSDDPAELIAPPPLDTAASLTADVPALGRGMVDSGPIPGAPAWPESGQPTVSGASWLGQALSTFDPGVSAGYDPGQAMTGGSVAQGFSNGIGGADYSTQNVLTGGVQGGMPDGWGRTADEGGRLPTYLGGSTNPFGQLVQGLGVTHTGFAGGQPANRAGNVGETATPERAPRQLDAGERRILECNGVSPSVLDKATLVGFLPPFAYLSPDTEGQTLPDPSGGSDIFLRNGNQSGASDINQLRIIAHEISHAVDYDRGVSLAAVLGAYALQGYAQSIPERNARAFAAQVVNNYKNGICR
jgi:hypothetical protein